MSRHDHADDRVRNTRALLHGALAALVHEKPYDQIVVREILARASVGRSTFYAHYRDKDELLEQGIRELLRADARPPERWTSAVDRLLRFSLPFLEQVGQHREHDELPLDPSAAALIHEPLRRVLERMLVADVRAERRRGAGGRTDAIPAELLGAHVAATFVLALEWWLQHPTLDAREIDARFRALVVPMLGAELGG
jgi:AcrR family transcriptional regulator